MTSFRSHRVWGSLSEKAALELKREGWTDREMSTPSRGDCLVKVQRTRQRSIPSDEQSGKGTRDYAKARRHRCDRYEELQVLQLRKGACGNGKREKKIKIWGRWKRRKREIPFRGCWAMCEGILLILKSRKNGSSLVNSEPTWADNRNFFLLRESSRDSSLSCPRLDLFNISCVFTFPSSNS